VLPIYIYIYKRLHITSCGVCWSVGVGNAQRGPCIFTRALSEPGGCGHRGQKTEDQGVRQGGTRYAEPSSIYSL
jgi:hypothetical protein